MQISNNYVILNKNRLGYSYGCSAFWPTIVKQEGLYFMDHYLNLNILPTLYSPQLCGIKVFMKNEIHETRQPSFNTLLMIFSGTLRFIEDGRPVDVKAGSYYIQRANTQQSGLPIIDPPVYWYIHFFGEFVNLPHEGTLPLEGNIDINKIRQAIISLSYRGNSQVDRMYQFYKILHLLGRYNRSCNNQLASRIADYLSSNAVIINSLDDVASHFNYSKDYIIRVFKKEFKVTPYNYLCALRIDLACQLITSSNLSIAQVAEQCGYHDLSVFYRTFKSIMGFPPTSLRKRGDYEPPIPD